MKEKLINFLEILIVLILIIAVLFIGYMIYDTFFDEGVDTGLPGVVYPDIDYSQIDKKDKKEPVCEETDRQEEINDLSCRRR